MQGSALFGIIAAMTTTDTPIYDALVAELNIQPLPVKMTTPRVGQKPVKARKGKR